MKNNDDTKNRFSGVFYQPHNDTSTYYSITDFLSLSTFVTIQTISKKNRLFGDFESDFMYMSPASYI